MTNDARNSSGSAAYVKSGVDTDAADAWVEGIASRFTRLAPPELKKKLISGVGDYAAVYALSESQWVATSCDGVGTKLLWTEAGLGRAEDMARDLLGMNANDVLCVGARPTLFLDYLAVGSKDLLKNGAVLDRFLEGLLQACAETNQICVGGETAQLPDLYPNGTFDLAGFSVGFLKPSEFLSVEGIQPGAEVWGWRSSGPHSNGFSWLRKIFDTQKDAGFIREHFMAPTRLYVNEFFRLREMLAGKGHAIDALQAAYHITGSGLLNLLRAQPRGRSIGFDLSRWPALDPNWVNEVRTRGNATDFDLFTAFNMGFGMLVVLDSAVSQREKSLLSSLELEPLGTVINEAVVKVRGLELV